MWTNSVQAMYNFFADNCHTYNWAFGFRELECLEEHATTEGLRVWHDKLVEMFYAHCEGMEEAKDYVITL